MKIISIIILFVCAVLVTHAQTLLKSQALEQFKAEHYQEAVSTLEKAALETPDDAEIYYYLGFFNHYIGSDSRLSVGYNDEFVEKILSYLGKAIELNPDYGDAKYFYGAECATNAFIGMQNRDLPRMKRYLQRAYNKGAFPKWLTEFGRNILNSCEQNAILFTAGDADTNVCLYLQIVENVRPDVSVMPIGNIDRPWYVQYIKDGLEGVMPKVSIGLSDNQIMQIRPFKWKPTPIYINVGDDDKRRLNLPNDFKMRWEVAPDLYSMRMHSKIEGEEEKPRTYLGPQRAMLLQIVEDNMAIRPIYFTNFSDPAFYGGIENYFQDCGLVSKLIPINTKHTKHEVDYESIEKLMQETI